MKPVPRHLSRDGLTGTLAGVHRELTNDQRKRQQRQRSAEVPAVALPPALITRGACGQPGADPDLWFTAGREDEATAACESCPVITECRDWAAATRPQDGIWAGLTPVQRGTARERYRRHRDQHPV